jgi:hypothetical protein
LICYILENDQIDVYEFKGILCNRFYHGMGEVSLIIRNVYFFRIEDFLKDLRPNQSTFGEF